MTSITTGAPQRLLFDRARVPVVAGRRVAVVDDVISTGASVCAALNILRRVGAEPVVIGAMLTEASTWRVALGEDAALVHALGGIPVFRRERVRRDRRGLGRKQRPRHRPRQRDH